MVKFAVYSKLGEDGSGFSKPETPRPQKTRFYSLNTHIFTAKHDVSSIMLEGFFYFCLDRKKLGGDKFRI